MKNFILIAFLFFFSILANESGIYSQKLQAQGMVVDTTGMASFQGMVDPKPYFFDGLKALQLNDLDAALEYFSMAHTLLPEQAGINYALADTYLRMGDLTSAAYHAKEAARIQPNNKWYWLKLSLIYRSSAQFDDAFKSLEKAAAIDPNDTQILRNMLALLASLNRYEEAIDIVKRIGEKQGFDQEILLQLYALQEEVGQIDEAIGTLKKLLDIEPNDEDIYNALTQLLLNAERYDEAIELFQKTLETNPNNLGKSLLLIETYVRADKAQEALALFDQQWTKSETNEGNRSRIAQFIVSLNQDVPNPVFEKSLEKIIGWLQTADLKNPQMLALLIDYYTQKGEASAAIPLLKKLTDMLPDNDLAWRQYLQFLYTEQRFDEVVIEGIKADELVPDDPYITFFVGSSFQIEGQSVKALEWLERSASIPADKKFRSIVNGSLGDTFAASDLWEDAYKAYDKALRYDPENDNVLNNYAYYLSESGGDLAKAEEMSRKAIQIQPNQASYLDTLGWILYLQKDFKEALKWIKKAVDTGNASPTVIEHFGDVYEALNDSKNAKKWWGKALEMDATRTYLKEKIN